MQERPHGRPQDWKRRKLEKNDKVPGAGLPGTTSDSLYALKWLESQAGVG